MPDSCHILAYCVPQWYERVDLRPLVGCFGYLLALSLLSPLLPLLSLPLCL